jgi:hypothetical protein
MSYGVRTVVLILVLMAAAHPARAQSPATVRYDQFFNALFAPALQDIRANGGPVLPVRRLGSASALNALLVAQIVNLPTGSNAGGFTWAYDGVLGTWSRVSDSFGPQTVERAQTVGRRKANIGFTFQRYTFDQLNGEDISLQAQGGLTGTQLFLRDRVSLSRADVSVSTTFVNFGITSRIDVGVFFPVVSIAVDGSADYILRRFSNGPVLAQGTNTLSAREQRVGDPVFRGKWNFVRRPHWGLAFAAEGRLHSSNQLGAGGVKFLGIASVDTNVVNAHASYGYSGFDCNNEPEKLCDQVQGFIVAGGVDKAVTKRLTLSGDVQVQRIDTQLISQTIPSTAVLPPDGSYPTLAGRADTATATLTSKFNLWGNLLVTFSAVVPANKRGLTDGFTPIIGVDYAF